MKSLRVFFVAPLRHPETSDTKKSQKWKGKDLILPHLDLATEQEGKQNVPTRIIFVPNARI